MKIIDLLTIELLLPLTVLLEMMNLLLQDDINEAIKNHLSKLLFYINDAIIKVITGNNMQCLMESFEA